MKRNNLLASTGLRAIMGPMTAAERATGRYLRAPDGHGDGGEGGDGSDGGQGASGAATVTIESRVTKLDAVPEPLRRFYRQDGDAFVLDDPEELRGHLRNVKEENKSLKGKNSKFNKLVEAGVDVDTAIQLAKEAKERETQILEEKGQWDSLKGQMEENFNKERETWTGRESKLLGTINKILVDDAARAALADPDIDGNPVLLLPQIRDRVKVTETDEGFVLQVLRPDGEPMLNSKNEPASLKDLFLEMKGKQEYAGAFKGVNQSGGGASSNAGGSGSGAPGNLKRSTMSNIEKVQYIREHGQAAYEKLPA